MERDIKPTYDELESYVENLQKQLADAQATIAALEETILKMGENAAVVAKDAMAAKEQVAALQGQVRELEQWVQDQSTANLETMRHTDEMQSRALEAEQQLTQRTAERDTARRRVDELEAREVDVVLLREDLEKRTAELEAAKRKVDLAEKKAWLAAHDVGFFSMWNGTDHSGPPKLALLCNDTFAWATADAEDVLDAQIDTIVELFKSEGEAGVIKWIAQQRNMKPMESVGKWLFGCDAIKKERNDLQAELERVRGLVKTYADAKIDFDDKRLQEDHHAWRERYTRLVGAETILIALTATSQEGQHEAAN